MQFMIKRQSMITFQNNRVSTSIAFFVLDASFFPFTSKTSFQSFSSCAFSTIYTFWGEVSAVSAVSQCSGQLSTAASMSIYETVLSMFLLVTFFELLRKQYPQQHLLFPFVPAYVRNRKRWLCCLRSLIQSYSVPNNLPPSRSCRTGTREDGEDEGRYRSKLADFHFSTAFAYVDLKKMSTALP